MSKSMRLLAGGLFFAVMLVFAGVNAYENYILLGGEPGWGGVQQQGRLIVAFVNPHGPARQLREGDEVVALNGRPLTHPLQANEILRVDPDHTYPIVVRRDGQLLEFALHTSPFPSLTLAIFRLLYLIIPAIFWLTGVAVFALKPDDNQAVLLAIMFGLFIPEGQYTVFEGMPWLLASMVIVAGVLSNLLGPVFLHFFQIFPERSPLLRRIPRLPFYLYLPYLLILIPYFTADYLVRMLAPEQILVFRSKFAALSVANTVFFALCIAGGLLSLLSNYRHARPASRRKMRVVVAGSIAGFVPSFVLTAAYWALLAGVLPDLSNLTLQIIVLIAAFAFTLFPLSFAYAIVRHQVIPVRLIIRRGVRYVFVAQGSVVLELIAVLLTLMVLLNTVFTSLQVSSLGMVVGSGLVSIAVWHLTNLLHRRVIAPVIDRHFFRRAYNAQQVLSDLGNELRRVSELREMLALVSTKIQDALQTEDVTIFLRHEASGDYRCVASSQPVGDGHIMLTAHRDGLIPADAFVVARLRESAQPLAVDFHDPKSWAYALASADAASNQTMRRECETLQLIRSELLLPIATKDQLLGILSLGPRLGDLPFSREDKQLLMAVVWQMALSIENTHLISQKAEEERMRRELEFATQVQRRLFPQCPPELASLELAGVCHPASGVGGDYYDFLVLGNGQIGIAVADVAGKGVSAALLMSTVQASLRSQVLSFNVNLTELVASMNRLLCDSTDTGSYATFFYAQFDEQMRQLTYVNAGHNPPLLVRAGAIVRAESARQSPSTVSDVETVQAGNGAAMVEQTVCLLETGGPVIGLFETCTYEHETIPVRSGDLIVAYTDGVTEALDPEGEEFDESRLRQLVTTYAHLSAEELKEQIVQSVREWCRDAPQSDDMTLVVMKVK